MAEENRMQELEQAPVGRLLVKYSLPAVVAMVAYSLYNVIASIYIGHGVGDMALSGLAVAFPVMNLTFALGTLVGLGSAAVCSIRLGQQDREGAFRVLGTDLVLSIALGVAFGWGLVPFLAPLLVWFGASPATLPHAYDFMLVTLWCLPLTYCFFNLNHVMRATGYPHKAMGSAMITVVANVVIAPILVFHLRWGMTGAAIATGLAQVAGLLWVLGHFRDSGHVVHFRRRIYALQGRTVRAVCAIGLAPCLVNLCGCIVVVVINKMLLLHGGDLAVGAYGIINRILTLFAMVVIGLTQGLQPIAGYNFGAGRLDRVLRVLKYGILGGTAITSLGFVLCELVPGAITRMFTSGETLIEIAVRGLRISVVVWVLVGSQIVIGNFFQAIGKPHLSIFLSLTRQLLFLVPLLLVLPGFYGERGVWLSFPIADLLSVVVGFAALFQFLRRMRPRQPFRNEET